MRFQKGNQYGIHFQKGENHPNWKGDKVGYRNLHRWIRNHLPQPELCQICNNKPSYEVANKGIYNRDIKNWFWSCRSCHMKYDYKNGIRIPSYRLIPILA